MTVSRWGRSAIDGEADAGLTLIELIVGIVVSTIVLAAVGTIFINSWLTQNDVLSTSEATNRGQLMGSSIEKAMRNALYFEVKASGSELWVRTTFSDSRHCQAFRVSDGMAETKSDATSVAAGPWGTWLDVADYDSFEVNVVVPAAGAFTQTPSTGTGTSLDYDFSVDTDSAPVQFSGDVSIRAGEAGNGGCW